MLQAPIPKNDVERLQKLWSYQILDTPPEPAFNEIVELLSSLCDAPIALVSLVDENRQWFKASHGLDAKETPRDVSFCGHAIHEQDIFEVVDARSDERFSDNPLVLSGPHVTFYAGMPLRDDSGHALGTLCVIDQKPKRLTDLQKQSLRTLANQVVAQLRLRKTLLLQQERIREVTELSKTIVNQQAALVSTARMSSLGQMARGLAHEINNPLAVILGRISIMQGWFEVGVPDPQKLLKGLEQVLGSSERIAKIVSGLRSYARSDVMNAKEQCSLQEVVENTLVLVKERFKMAQIEFEVSPIPDCKALCRPGQIAQILMNLLSNAYDACPHGAGKKVKIEFEQSDLTFTFTISDNGPGVSEEVSNSLFDPFVTTKPPDQGTGIGLSIAKSFAIEHGGDIEFERKGDWTVFRFWMQLNSETQSASKAA